MLEGSEVVFQAWKGLQAREFVGYIDQEPQRLSYSDFNQLS